LIDFASDLLLLSEPGCQVGAGFPHFRPRVLFSSRRGFAGLVGNGCQMLVVVRGGLGKLVREPGVLRLHAFLQRRYCRGKLVRIDSEGDDGDDGHG
jgi:hypothetical protein